MTALEYFSPSRLSATGDRLRPNLPFPGLWWKGLESAQPRPPDRSRRRDRCPTPTRLFAAIVAEVSFGSIAKILRYSGSVSFTPAIRRTTRHPCLRPRLSEKGTWGSSAAPMLTAASLWHRIRYHCMVDRFVVVITVMIDRAAMAISALEPLPARRARRRHCKELAGA